MSPNPASAAAALPVPARCRLCGSADNLDVLHAFGVMPPAGYLEPSRDLARGAPRYPLGLAICRHCELVQQAWELPDAILAGRVYSQYQPTYTMSRRVAAYVEEFLDAALRESGLVAGDRVLEVGSNDGSLLRALEERGLEAVGVEPARSLVAAARARGATVIQDYFGAGVARAYASRYQAARLVISRHTLEHAFDPIDFLRGVAEALDPAGWAVIEVPYLRLQILSGHFEAMTFQHVSFFTVRSIRRALHAAGLTLVDVSFVTMDGGSMVVRARKGAVSDIAPRLRPVLELEGLLELDRPRGYARFFQRVGFLRTQVRDYLAGLATRGLAIAAYGAGSKGQSLLNMLGVDADHVPFVIDDTPGAAGLYVPGPGIEVVANRDPRVRRPDVILLTAPTHIAEILANNADRRAAGTQFLATVPDLHLVADR